MNQKRKFRSRFNDNTYANHRGKRWTFKKYCAKTEWIYAKKIK